MLTGLSGTGKKSLVNKIKKHYDMTVSFLHFGYQDFVSRYLNDTTVVKSLFQVAKLTAPSVIVISEPDKFLDKDSDPSKQRILTDFLCSIDSLLKQDKAVVLYVVENSSSIDEQLKENSRLSSIVEMRKLTVDERRQLIEQYLGSYVSKISDDELNTISEKTQGYCGGDLKKAVEQAFLLSYGDKNESYFIDFANLEKAIQGVKPINLRDILIEVPEVHWKDIGGNKDIIENIRRSIEWPLKHPEKFARMNIEPPKVFS